MLILEKIRNAQTTTDLFFVTILPVSFHVLLLFSAVYTAAVAAENAQSFILKVVLVSIPLFIGYVLLTIIYCTTFSILFRPKRIVSPVNVQIGTGIAVSFIVFYGMVAAMKATTMYQTLIFLGNLTLAMFFLTLFLVVIGAFQLIFVRWLVGLNLVGMDRKSYSIDGDVEAVDKAIREFLAFRGYVRRSDIEKEILYRRPSSLSEQVILTLGQDPKNKHNSILATVAFHKGTYGIETSKFSSDFRNSTIYEMTTRLLYNERSFEINEIKDDDFGDPMSAWAYGLAYAPTLSRIPRIETLGTLIERIPSFYRALIAVTIVILIGINVAFWTNFSNFDFNTYISITVGLVVALFVEAGIPLREEVFRKKEKAS